MVVTASIERAIRYYHLDIILDACVAVYKEELDENGQVDFKSKAKAFVRTYGFLSSVLPYNYGECEKRSIFLNFLVPKLPAPKEEDLSQGTSSTSWTTTASSAGCPISSSTRPTAVRLPDS